MHLSLWGTDEPAQRSALPVPAALPAMLQVHALAVHLQDAFHRDAQAFCAAPVWARFATAARAFGSLQHVVLVQRCRLTGDSATVVPEHDPAFLGMTDEVFEPLVEAGRLVSRWQDAQYRTVREVRGTVRPRGPEKPAGKVGSGEAGSDVSCAEPEGRAGRPADGYRERLTLTANFLND